MLDYHKYSILFDLAVLRQEHNQNDRNMFNRALKVFLETNDVADFTNQRLRYAYQVLYIAKKFKLISEELLPECNSILEKFRDKIIEQ